MSFVAENPPSYDVLIELGKFAVEETGFVEFMDELAASGFVLVYEQDGEKTPEEFYEVVRTRWDTIKRAWRLRSGAPS